MDWRFILGLGLGLLLASVVMFAQNARPVSADKVERLARQMGMVYPQEVVTFREENENGKGDR
ncbi:MAG: hypothetical protein KGZ63_15075 [Clostridiales bacterium]|jgi:hypothetical protein|nr:hypothetical protein [Clostridiales bacterium]